MPPAHTFNNRSFYPFPIDYSSETFAPLVRSDQQISHVKYLLRGQPAAIARFRHYLTTCATIFALERTLQDLQNSRDQVFTEFITPDVVHRLQPFLIQTRRRSHLPPSATVIANARHQHVQTPTPQMPDLPIAIPTTDRTNHPLPIVRIPHTFHDNAPIVVTVPSAAPAVVRTPTPFPSSTAPPVRYVSPLLTEFDPCTACGSAVDGHYPGCTK